MSDLLDAIRDGRVRVGDGAMGTMLQDAGLDDGGAPELWNVDRPEIIADIFEQYVPNRVAGAMTMERRPGFTHPRLCTPRRLKQTHEATAMVRRPGPLLCTC